MKMFYFCLKDKRITFPCKNIFLDFERVPAYRRDMLLSGFSGVSEKRGHSLAALESCLSSERV
jgi:hypothetical protein